jgi:hypothetical protein
VCRLGEEVSLKDIPPGALKQYNRIFFAAKYKADGTFDRFSGRCFTDGSRQPDGTYLETYAGTGDGVDKFAMLAAYHARDTGRIEQGLDSQLSTFSFDITGAFLQGRLTEENCPQPAYIHFAHDIRHTCAGKWYRRYASTYGTKDANAIFDKTFVDTAAQAGFYPNTEDPKIFAKIHPTDPSLSCAVSMHVDDGLGCCTYAPYKEELRRVLTDRFGDLDWDDHPTSNTGINITHYTDGSYSLDQHGYLLRMLTDFGATELPFVSSPSLPDLFDPPTDPTPVDAKAFRQMVGALGYLLSTYHRVRKEVQHLQSRTQNPTQSDLDKAIRVLAYLNCHRKDYVRYSGSDYQVYIWVDAGYNNNDGRSTTGYYITVGEDSGAITSYAGKQTECVSSGASESEYVALARGLKKAVHIRRFLHSLGFAQTQPVTCFEDNMSAIKLAQAPAVSRKSKHIHVRYHLVRDYVKAGIVRMVFTPTDNMHADIFTKARLNIADADRHGQKILNISLQPLQSLQSARLQGDC